MPRLHLTVDLELDGPAQGWTDVTRDVLVRGGVSWDYGLPGPMPADRVAGIGECRFLLDNSAGIEGSYAPGHAQARAGFDLGIGCRLTLTHGTTRRRKLYYLESIQPTHGPAAERAVACIGTDWMGVAARARISDLPVQRDQRSDQIIQTILAALPVTPRQTALQPGRSTFDYALDDLRGEHATALEALHRVTVSELGYFTADADAADGETVAFLDRYARAHQQAAPPALRAAAQVALARELADVIDTARVGIPLRRVDSEATTVLYQLGDAAPAIVSGGTIHPFGPYRDPAQEAQRVGGADMQPPVAGTDYVANTAADGSGTDVTSQLTVTASFGASGVRWTISNSDPETVYLTTLQARGRGIYDYARAYLEAVDPSAGPSRGVITLGLPYQADLRVGQDVADHLLNVYGTPRTRPTAITIHAARDATLAQVAATVGLHDRITVRDAPTGVDVTSHVNRIAYRVGAPADVRVTYDLAPTDEADVWILGVSRLGETTRLGWG